MKKQVESIEGQDKVSKVEIIKLKERVDQFKSVSANNIYVCYRKRMQNPTVSTPEVPKRRRLQSTSSVSLVMRGLKLRMYLHTAQVRSAVLVVFPA